MANVWMHNGFLQVEGEKMSKSLGNFITIHELLESEKFGGRKWRGEVLRLAMLMTHYRQPIDWTTRSLETAEKILDRWYRAIGGAKVAETSDWAIELQLGPLADDLNTPEAISKLHVFADIALTGEEAGSASRFKHAANLLGLLQFTQKEWQQQLGVVVDEAKIAPLIAARLDARKRKDFAESDRIRDELAAMGIALKDTKNKQTGEIETTWEVMR